MGSSRYANRSQVPLETALSQVACNFIVAITPTSFKFFQFVSNFISMAVPVARGIRILLFLLRWLCQTLLFVHSWIEKERPSHYTCTDRTLDLVSDGFKIGPPQDKKSDPQDHCAQCNIEAMV